MGFHRTSLVLAVCFSTCAAANPPSPSQPFLTTRAKLLKAMRTGTLKEGDSFLLRTTSSWEQDGCAIPANTTITGEVAVLTASGGGPRRVTWGLRFTPVFCAGDDRQQVTPLLIAMQGPSRTGSDAMKRLESRSYEDQTLEALGMPHYDTDHALNSAGHAAQATYAVPSAAQQEHPLKTGEVDGVSKVLMELPSSTPVTTLLSSREIALPQDTEFVLRFINLPLVSLPAKEKERRTLRMADATERSAPPLPRAEPEITEVCASSGCKQLLPLTASSSGRSVWTVSLKDLGLDSRPNQTIRALEEDATVRYLGQEQILVTFPLHGLLRHAKHGADVFSKPRRVRAVLLSARDGQVLAMQEWGVVDSSGAYLWPLGNAGVLVHVGDELISYGPGLTIQHRFLLPGPLAYASTSSGGSLALAAVVHERHSSNEHQHLTDFLGPNIPVQEDFDLIGLNGSLQEISRRLVHEEPPRPALLDTGIVAAEPRKADVWNVREVSLTGEGKDLAQMRSTCGLQISSLSGSLLLVRSCEGYDRLPAFRLLNAGGATVLKGLAPYGDFFQQAATDSAASKIAVAMSHFESPIDLAAGMHSADFKELAVTVYRTGDAKPVFTAKPADGSAASQTLALSPAGDHLAVMTREALQAYLLP